MTEGKTPFADNGHETSLGVADPTADRIVTIPDCSTLDYIAKLEAEIAELRKRLSLIYETANNALQAVSEDSAR